MQPRIGDVMNCFFVGVIMYKSIMLSNREHTREVICSAMLKHGLEGAPEDFTLAQMLPDKGELLETYAHFFIYALCTYHFRKS